MAGENGGRGEKRGFEGEKVGGELGDGEDEEWEEREQKEEAKKKYNNPLLVVFM